MKFISIIYPVILAAALMAVEGAVHGQMPMGNGFQYSRTGLKINNQLLNGTYDVRIRLFDALTRGSQVGPTIDIPNVNINAGKLPTQLLNFGDGSLDGEARFIEIRARQGGGGYLLTGQRQRVRPVPYALALPGLYVEQNATSPSLIGGYAGNFIDPMGVGSVIAGGGASNEVQTITAEYGSIGGGRGNTVSGRFGHIGGGGGNSASGDSSTVGGGGINVAAGAASTVSGGSANEAQGNYATVIGGIFSSANGAYSVAGGLRARALHHGSVVLSDAAAAFLPGAPSFLTSSADHQFTFRASNGFRFYTNAATTLGAKLDPSATAWSVLCDREVKCNIRPVNVREIADRLSRLSISKWNYIDDDRKLMHLGPMAQDFHEAFGLGSDDKSISTLDADGVLFAAFQGLHQLIQEKDTELAELRAQNAQLQLRLERIETMLMKQEQ